MTQPLKFLMVCRSTRERESLDSTVEVLDGLQEHKRERESLDSTVEILDGLQEHKRESFEF